MLQKKMRLGDLLIQHQLITQQQLEQAIAKQRTQGNKLGKVLVDMGFISEEKLLNLLSEQLNIPFIDLKFYEFDKTLIKKLPETHARRFRAILLKDIGNAVLVGMADPLDLYAYDELARSLKRPLQLALVREAELLRTIDLLYRRSEEITEFAEALSDELDATEIDLDQINETPGAQDAPVVKLLQSLFTDAVQVGASDIHIEPGENTLRIRQRVDGMLQEQIMQNKRIASALTQRLKLMANINIAERRIPQDGRFNIKVKERSIDVRLSTMPTQFGESVVMRLLDQSAEALNLEQLGLAPSILQQIDKLLKKPHGMILVTGPTGSGKTTTLYSMLNKLNLAERKIITVEDPVEYRLARINQVQVNPKIDLSFSRVLRSALRQDPDILMVGEIRDQETATIALRAAMTGHLVLATLHTNDATTSAMRLIDMGVEPYLVAAAIKAVIAQRLLRRICESCARDYQPTLQEQTWLEKVLKDDYRQNHFRIGEGCTHCNKTGYQGRVGVFELLELDTPMLQALRNKDPLQFVDAARQNQQTRSLELAALDLAMAGITTLAEALRIVDYLEEVDLQIAREEYSIEHEKLSSQEYTQGKLTLSHLRPAACSRDPEDPS